MRRRFDFKGLLETADGQRGLFLGSILLVGMVFFEIENYWTTWFSLNDILGPIQILTFRWATLLALAACAIDFAGIARIFTPEQGRDEPAEVWYLFGAWLLAASFDAILTWWSVSLAIQSKAPSVVLMNGGTTMLKAIPIGFAAFELLIRVLLINTFATAGDRLFSMADRGSRYRPSQKSPQPTTSYRPPQPQTQNFSTRPAPKSTPAATHRPLYSEPTYHPAGRDLKKE